MTQALTYRDAGVDIDAGDELVQRIRPLAESTRRPGVLTGIGGFGGLFELGRYRQPVLVSGADGVGTKLRLAFAMNRHDTVGIDLVAMNVNDILAQGAEPLYFLDYFACGRLEVDTAEAVVRGIAEGCRQAGCALIGGETAEMPSMYPEGEYDLAGFAVGVVERDAIITGEGVEAGDAIIGLASSGLHSNGYSLARKVLERSGAGFDTPLGTTTLGEALLAPTRIYVRPVLSLLERQTVRGMAHITGGGLLENIPRALPSHLAAELHRQNWQWPDIFGWLQGQGGIEDREMYRTFNCGIGYVLIVPAAAAEAALSLLRSAGETAAVIGGVVPRGQDAGNDGAVRIS